jgi:glycosyltransferase involved in cell wall biosynthesis
VAALAALCRQRPRTRVVVFGDRAGPEAPFGYENAGVATPDALARLYSEGTVGLCLSLTNVSLTPQEMLACGMPCVDLDGPSTRAAGDGGAVTLAPFDPEAMAAALARLLDDEAQWRRRAEAGRALVAERTWERTATEVEAGLRDALRREAPVA